MAKSQRMAYTDTARPRERAPNGCGAGISHIDVDPNFAHVRSVNGSAGAAAYLTALEDEVLRPLQRESE